MFVTNTRIVIATALAASTLAVPAFAKVRPVVMPAASIADDAARLCMPKTTLEKPAKDLPATICQTVAEWKAQGVVFVGK